MPMTHAQYVEAYEDWKDSFLDRRADLDTFGAELHNANAAAIVPVVIEDLEEILFDVEKNLTAKTAINQILEKLRALDE